MWIIRYIDHHSKYEFTVGPFGCDDQAVAAVCEVEVAGTVDGVV